MSKYVSLNTEEKTDPSRETPRQRRARWAPFWMGLILAAVVLTLVFAILAWDNSKKPSSDGGQKCNSKEPVRYRGQDSNGTNWRQCDHISAKNVDRLKLHCKFMMDGESDGGVSVAEDGIAYFNSWNGTFYAMQISDCSLVCSGLVSDYTGVLFDKARTAPALTSDGTGVTFGTGWGNQSAYAGAFQVRVNRFTCELDWAVLIDDQPFALITKSNMVEKGIIFGGVSSSEEAAAAFVTNYTCCEFRGSTYWMKESTGEIIQKVYTIAPNVTSGAAVWGSSGIIDFDTWSWCIATGNLYDERDLNATCVLNPPGGDPNNCLTNTTLQNSIVCYDILTGSVQNVFRAGFPDVWTVACIIPFKNPGNCPINPGPDADFGQGPQSALSKNPATGARRRVIIDCSKGGICYALNYDDFVDGEASASYFLWATQAGPGGVTGGMQWGSANDNTGFYFALSNSEFRNWTLLNGTVVCGGGWGKLNTWDGTAKWLTPDPNAGSGAICNEIQANYTNGTVVYDFAHLNYLAVDKGPVTLVNDVMFGGSYTGMMYALDASTGVELWNYNTSGSINGPAFAWDGFLIFSGGYSRIGGVGGNHEMLVFHH